MNLQEAIRKIVLPDKEYGKKAALRLDDQARPKGSLGLLEDTARRLAGISKTMDVRLDRKIIVTCAGDHGVIVEGVSLFPQEVTAQMVYNFVDGGASINVLARHAGACVRAADLGVNHDFSPELPIFHKKIAKSTDNIRKEAAMTRKQAIESIEAGISITEALAEDPGLDLLGTGDMGIGNTTPSAAVIAAFSGLDVKKLAGRGTGLDDRALEHKIRVIEDALELHRPDPGDPVDVLAKVGGFEIGGLAGLVIGAAVLGIPVVCDGLIATAGALIACEIAPSAKSYLFASHRSVEAGHNYMLQHLGIEPLLDLKLRLGEGTGAALAMEIMDASTRVLAEIRTFEEVQIRNAQK
ncbi:MAG: nicotinate-nucleotide--dimethylbenzimidazole phosphoribosyltransferase [Desulfosalsimonas sp.]